MTVPLQDMIETIDKDLVVYDEKREMALKKSREIIRRSAALIMGCHRGDATEDLLERWNAIRKMLNELNSELVHTPSLLRAGFVESAQGEAVEAVVVLRLRQNVGAEGNDFYPEADKLGVGGVAYLKGLGDVMGELRRFTLNALRDGDMEAAQWYYEQMEVIFSSMTGLRYTHTSSDLRRKMDTARVLLERTLGELVHIQHLQSVSGN